LIKIALLIVKRALFIMKFKRFCRKNGIVCTVNSVFLSLFSGKGTPNITVEKRGKTVDIFIFSNIFRHARYHFLENERVEIYHVGRGVIPFLGRNHLRTFAANPDGITRLNETKLMTAKFLIPEKALYEQAVLVHPIPLYVTRVLGNGPRKVYDGEELVSGMKLYSGSGLRKMLLKL